MTTTRASVRAPRRPSTSAWRSIRMVLVSAALRAYARHSHSSLLPDSWPPCPACPNTGARRPPRVALALDSLPLNEFEAIAIRIGDEEAIRTWDRLDLADLEALRLKLRSRGTGVVHLERQMLRVGGVRRWAAEDMKLLGADL